MKNSKFRILCVLSCLLIILSAFAGCKNGGGDSVALENFEDATIDVSYTSIYALDTVVRDTDGNPYVVQLSLKDSKGNEVSVVGGKLVVADLDGYTLTQTLTIDGETYNRTITLNVVKNAKPVIELGEMDTVMYFGREYELPQVTVKDIFGNTTDKFDVTYEVFTSNEDQKQTVDGNKYTPVLSGEQYVKVTATNKESKASNYAVKEFKVRPQASAGEFENFNDQDADRFVTVGTALASKEYLQSYQGKTGVIGVTTKKIDGTRILARVFPKEQDVSKYDMYQYLDVTLYFAVENSFINTTLYTDRHGSAMYNNSDLKFEGVNAIAYNQWKTYRFPALPFISSWSNILEQGFVLSSGNSDANGGQVYIDDISFANDEDFTEVSLVTINKNSFVNGDNVAFESGKVYDNAELKTATSLATCYSDSYGAWYCATNQLGRPTDPDDPDFNKTVAIKVKSAMSKDAINFYKDLGFTKVKIPVMAYVVDAVASETSYVKLIKGDNGVLSASVEFVGGTYVYNTWYTLEVSVDTLLNKLDADGYFTLCDNIIKYGRSATFYVGAITLNK